MLQRHCQSSAFASMLGSTLKSTGKFCPPQIIYILSFPNFRNSLMCTSSVALLVMLLVFTLAILLGQKFLITIVCRKYSKYYDKDTMESILASKPYFFSEISCQNIILHHFFVVNNPESCYFNMALYASFLLMWLLTCLLLFTHQVS